MKKKFNLKMKLASTLLVVGFVTTGYLNSTSAFTATGTGKGQFSYDNFNLTNEKATIQGKKNAKTLLERFNILNDTSNKNIITQLQQQEETAKKLEQQKQIAKELKKKLEEIEKNMKQQKSQNVDKILNQENEINTTLQEKEKLIQKLKQQEETIKNLRKVAQQILNKKLLDRYNSIAKEFGYTNKQAKKNLINLLKLVLVVIESGGMHALPDNIDIPEELKTIYSEAVKMNDSTAKLQEQTVLKQINMIVDPTAPYGINDDNYTNYINKINDAQKKSNFPIPIAAINVDDTTVSGKFSKALINQGITNTVLDNIEPVTNSTISSENNGLFYDEFAGALPHQISNNSFFETLDNNGQNPDDNLYFSFQMRKNSYGENGYIFARPRFLYNKNDEKARLFCKKFIKYFLLTLSEDFKELASNSPLLDVYNNDEYRFVPNTTPLSHPILLFTEFPSNLQQQALMLDKSWQDIYSTAAIMALNEINGILPNYAKITLNAKIINDKLMIYVTSDVTGNYLENLESVYVFVKNAYNDTLSPKEHKLLHTANLQENTNKFQTWQGEFNLNKIESEKQIDWKNEKGNKFYLDVYGDFKTIDGSKKINKFLTNVANFEVGPKTTRKFVDGEYTEFKNKNEVGIKINEITAFKVINETE